MSSTSSITLAIGPSGNLVTLTEAGEPTAWLPGWLPSRLPALLNAEGEATTTGPDGTTIRITWDRQNAALMALLRWLWKRAQAR